MIFLRVWDILIMLGATSAALAIPVRLVFGLSGHASLVALHWAISVVFLGDILIHLFRPVSFRGQVISDRRAVALHYLKGWFFVDLRASGHAFSVALQPDPLYFLQELVLESL